MTSDTPRSGAADRRPPAHTHEPPGAGHWRLSSSRVQLGLAMIVALLIWPLAVWDPSDEPIEASVAGVTMERTETLPTLGIPTTTATIPTTTAPVPETTTTTATQAPAPATTATKKARKEPPSTTTTATTAPKPPATTTTTATKPPPLAGIARQSTSQILGNVRLTLTAAPPASGAARTAEYRLETEFGDVRVLRAVRFDFGDGISADAPVIPWACWDPAAPNPYVLNGPTHVYPSAGTYTVTVTVRTVACVADQAEGTSETVQMRLDVVVP